MKLLKISPSILNNFARYLDESLEYETLERLLEKFEKPFQLTGKMAFGTACHKLIENPCLYLKGKYFHIPNDEREATILGKEIVLSKEFVKPLVDFNFNHPEMVYEQKYQKKYHVKGYEVLMSMRVDGIEIDTVYDFKITDNSPKFDEYLNSYQWRCYLDAMALPCFVYQVFQHHGKGTDKKLTTHYPVTLYSYESLANDVESMIWQFIKFIEDFNYVDRFIFNE